MELLTTNVKHKRLQGSSLLIHGTCVDVEAPQIFREFSKRRIPLHVCLEKEHMNMVGFKLATILKTSKPKDIMVLTTDGSPHCLQLHFAVEQAKNIAGSDVKVAHYTIAHGKPFQISPEAVKTARHLSQIEKLLSKRKC
jgi:hypothetical protein